MLRNKLSRSFKIKKKRKINSLQYIFLSPSPTPCIKLAMHIVVSAKEKGKIQATHGHIFLKAISWEQMQMNSVPQLNAISFIHTIGHNHSTNVAEHLLC